MSLLPAETCQEGVWQYCNYGYDSNIYSSYNDCLIKKTQSDCGTIPYEYIIQSKYVFALGAIVAIIIFVFLLKKFLRFKKKAKK